MRGGRALLLAVLLLAPLASLAGAAPPQKAGWAPYDAISRVTDLALAADGSVIGATLTAAAAPSLGSTRVASSDFIVFTPQDGAVRNGSSSSPTPLGRSHVATTADGTAFATLALDVPVPSPPQTAGRLVLKYSRLPPGGAWNTSMPVLTSVNLFGNASDLLLSEDGSRVVVGINDNGTYTIRGYRYRDATLEHLFDVPGQGILHDLAGSADLGHVVAALRRTEGASLHGAVLLIPFVEGRVAHTFYDRHAELSAVSTVAMSGDGTRFAAGGEDGYVYLFRNEGAATRAPQSANVAAGTVKLLAMSRDGSRLAAAVGTSLSTFDLSAGALTPAWTYGAVGDIQDAAWNATGGLLVAAVGSSGGGALGFDADDREPIWRFGGATQAIAVDAAGTSVAYAQGSLVTLVQMTRGLRFSHPDGAAEGPRLVAAPQGTAVYRLELQNTGSTPERVVIDGPRDLDVAVQTTPAQIPLRPGETKTIQVNVTPGRIFPGDHAFNLTARALRDGLSAEVRVNLTVTATVAVNLYLAEGAPEQDAAPGVERMVLLGVRNSGNRDAAVGIRATQSVSAGGPWSVRVDPASFTLVPDAVTTVRVFVTPPDDAEDGTANTLRFSLEGESVSDAVTVTFRVNPKVGVSVDATGRVKFVEPGSSTTYNVTVLNNGSLPRRFEMIYDVTASGNLPWSADVALEPFRLEPGASRTVAVRVLAPFESAEGDRATILVAARTLPELENETVVSSNVTLFATVVAPPPGTPDDAGRIIPGPLLATAALAAAVAAALRRRRLP